MKKALLLIKNWYKSITEPFELISPYMLPKDDLYCVPVYIVQTIALRIHAPGYHIWFQLEFVQFQHQ